MVAGPFLVLAGLVVLVLPVPRPARHARLRRGTDHLGADGLRMTVAVTLDMLSATPPYEQVRSQIAGHIRTGSIRAGEKLPVVRALAADLGVATNTVARAYRELEAGGLVTTRRRVGTIVQAVAGTGQRRSAAPGHDVRPGRPQRRARGRGGRRPRPRRPHRPRLTDREGGQVGCTMAEGVRVWDA